MQNMNCTPQVDNSVKEMICWSTIELKKKTNLETWRNVDLGRDSVKYRVIQEESAILWEMIVCVILSKQVQMNMGPILNGCRDMVKRRYGPSCEHEQ